MNSSNETIFINVESARSETELADRIRQALQDAGPSESHLRFDLFSSSGVARLIRALNALRPPSNVRLSALLAAELFADARIRRGLELVGVAELRELRSGGAKAAASCSTPVDGFPEDLISLHNWELGASGASEAVLRITYRCNARCPFCWVGNEKAEPAAETIDAALAALAGLQVKELSFSGGEPMLNPDLARWVARARELGIPRVILQTNGSLLASATRLRALRLAGLDMLLLAVHAAEAESGRRAFGGLLDGETPWNALDTALAEGLAVVANTVFYAENVSQLLPIAARLLETARRHGRDLYWNISSAAPMGATEQAYRSLAPRLEDLRRVLPEAIRLLHDSPVRIRGFESACGLPLCVLGDAIGLLEDLPSHPELGDDFFHPPVCDGCSMRSHCFGLRRRYAELFGADELRPYPENPRG
ncbi:MAG: radical SAM protein [Myxococcales bacterium]|nr:MAG: radical SAM protein [Myxococcales bacterium]